MPANWLLSTGNSLLNPRSASTYFPFWGLDFDPKNQASWLGLADYAYASLINTFRAVTNPLARISPQVVGQAALRQQAALGTAGVDLGMLGNRLSQGVAKKIIPSGALISRAAAPLYFAETLGGSTPSPVQAQQMIAEPLTPAPVTTFLENLLGISPTAAPQTAAPVPVVSANTVGGSLPTPPPIIASPKNIGLRAYLRRSKGGRGVRKI